MFSLRPALSLLIILTLLTGIVYPFITLGISQVLLSDQANGSLLLQNNKVIGSRLIGQAFTHDNYFWGRPSATSDSAYNAMASGGSNLAITNPQLDKNISSQVSQLRQADPDKQLRIPVDLLTASASGLDPHISVAAAQYQAPRIAQIRHLPLATVENLIAQHTYTPIPSYIGETVVNVLTLNQALDNEK